jgi:hypothetical protein
MCRSCGTAVPSTVHSAPRPRDDGGTWVTGGPIGAPVAAPTPRSGPGLAKAPTAPPTDAGPYDPPGPPHPVPHHAYPPSAYPGTPQTSGGPPRGLRGIASAAVVLLLVEVGALGAHVYARIQEAALVRDFQAGTTAIPLSRIQANDDLVHTTGLASVGLYVVALIALMTFTYLATVNVRRWDPAAKHTPGLAAASWIIPVANLVLPWIVLRQAIQVGARRVAAPAGAGLVVLWAVLQTVGLVTRFASASRHDELATAFAPDLDALVTSINGIAIGCGLLALGLLAGIATVLRIASLHDRTVGA